MLKRLIFSTSAFILAGGVALAQTPPVTDPSELSPMQRVPMSRPHWLVSDVYKAAVYDNSDQKVGDVTDLVMSDNGAIQTAVIGIGGFVGIGQKDVGIPFKDIEIRPSDGKVQLVLNRTKAQLQSQPTYEPTGRSAATSAASLKTTNWLVSDVYKADVYDGSENRIGDVTDLVLDGNGDIKMAVIGVGGVLGAGHKEVAVPFNELKVASRDGKNWMVLNRSKDELKNEPAYDKNSGIKKM